MNKKIVPIIIVVLLLLLGGWYFISSKKSATTPTNEITTATQPATSATNLKALLTKGVAQSCTYSNAATNGTLYISGGKMRGDIDTTVESVSTKTHMIVMNGTSYIWSEGQKTGFKMSFDQNATPSATAESPNAGTSGTFDANANMNYNCSPWVADESMFTLPAGVTFSTFAMPSGVVPAKDGSTSSQCSYCDNLTGSDKTQCLTALKCN